MTGAEKVRFAQVGPARSGSRCGNAAESVIRSLARTHAFCRVVTRESQFITAFPVTCACPAGCCQGQNAATGTAGAQSSQPVGGFRGIIFSIPMASTVVAYNISRHINIPEGRRTAPRRAAPRRSAHSLGEPE